MKRLLLAGTGLTLALSLLWVGFVGAANVRSGQSPRIMSDEVINGTLYAGGGDLKMQGTVQGDLMCAGQTIEITGTVEGDVLCAGQNITISGTVLGDVRAVGQVVTLKGKVHGSASLLGQNVDIQSTANIGRDATVLSQQTNVGGTVGRDVEVLSGTFGTTAKIGRDLDVTGETITLDAGAAIGGMFMYVSQNDATVQGTVAGKTEHKYPESTQTDAAEWVSPAAYVSSVVIGFSSFLLVGVVLLAGVPRLMRATSNAIKTAPLITLGAGFIGLIMPPFLAIMAFVTIIGIPLGITVFLGWIISLLTGLVFTAHTLGQLIVAKLRWQESWQQFASLVLGLFALFLVALIPYVGGLIMFIAVVWGVGSLWYVVVKRRTLTQAAESKGKKS